MKLYLYIDESGSIHKNSHTKYFAVGGYFSSEEDKDKIKAKYKRLNLKMKQQRNFLNNEEIKSYHMSDTEKIKILQSVQSIKGFYGCAKVFNKQNMAKEIIESNIFFNYAVKILIKDCILPILKNQIFSEKIEFIVSVDNRNIKLKNLNDLQTYLKTEFCIYGIDFKITYYDSKTNFGIQLADLIVNTFYNYYKNISIVKKVIENIDLDKFKISLFPGNKLFKNNKNKVDIPLNI